MIGHGKSWALESPKYQINVDNAKADTIIGSNEENFPTARMTGSNEGIVITNSETDADMWGQTFTVAADGTPSFVTRTQILAQATAPNYGGGDVGLKNPESSVCFGMSSFNNSKVGSTSFFTASDGSISTGDTLTPEAAYIEEDGQVCALGKFRVLVVGKGTTFSMGAVVGTQRDYDNTTAPSAAILSAHPYATLDEQDISQGNDASDTHSTSLFALDDSTAIHCTLSGSSCRFWNFRHISISGSDGYTITSTDNRIDLGIFYDDWSDSQACAIWPIDSTRFGFAMRGDYPSGTGYRLWAGVGSISGTTITMGTLTELNDETTGTLTSIINSVTGLMFGNARYGIVVTGCDNSGDDQGVHQITVQGTTVQAENIDYITGASNALDHAPVQNGLCLAREDCILVPFNDAGTPDLVGIVPVFLTPWPNTSAPVEDTIAYALDAPTSYNNSTSSHTVSAGTTDALFVVSWAEDSSTQTSAQLSALSWNSQSFTKLGEITGANSNGFAAASVWYLLDPTAGTANFSPTWTTGSPNRRQIGVWHYENVKQEAPYGFKGVVTDAVPVGDIITDGALAKSMVLCAVGCDDDDSTLYTKTTDAAHMYDSVGAYVGEEMQMFCSYSSDGSEVTFNFTDVKGTSTEPQTGVAFCFRDSDQ